MSNGVGWLQQSTAEDPAGAERDRGAVTCPLPDGVIVERDVRVEMRDGIHLSATVRRPAENGRFPVVTCVPVYGKDFSPDEYSTFPKIKASGNAVGTMHISEVTTWEGPDPGSWVPNGYVAVVADPRGYHDSEGQAGIYSEMDSEDHADLIEWTGVQPWSNGLVGLNGVSHLAISQWLCASQTKPSHPKAIMPWKEKVQPGDVVPVEIEILPSSTLFKAGESLRLVVSGRDIMEFARFGHDETVNKGRHRLHAGGEYPSSLLVPFC